MGVPPVGQFVSFVLSFESLEVEVSDRLSVSSSLGLSGVVVGGVGSVDGEGSVGGIEDVPSSSGGTLCSDDSGELSDGVDVIDPSFRDVVSDDEVGGCGADSSGWSSCANSSV